MPNTKPAFALRPPHSIRRELELLSPFVRWEQTGQMRPYTMAEIEATEQRLGCRLPEPISPHLELISNIGWPDLPERLHRIFAYYNPQDDCLLLTYPESPDGYYLLTKQPVPYSFAQDIAQKTGLVFCSRNGHGKELVTARRQEMQEQGLLY